MNETGAPFRVFIHGSCVSRDTFTTLDDRFTLVRYVARQSLISVDQPVAGVAEKIAPLASAFQDRAVRGDLAGDALTRLGQMVGSVDLVLHDLTDERGGVLRLGGGFASKLAEFWGNGGREASRGAEHIPFGTDEHFALWSAAWDRYHARLVDLGLAERFLVLDTPWASTLDNGAPLIIPTWMMAPDVANTLHRRYVARIADSGINVATLPDALVRSTQGHRWGASPFHYTEEAYHHLAERIVEVAYRAGRWV